MTEKNKQETSTSREVLDEIVTKHGDGIIVEDFYEDIPRLQTGIFPFDLASGGGLPFNRVSEVFGYEGKGKTNLALKTIANAQRLYPDKKCVLVDVERTYDPTWGALLGVDNEALILVKPDHAAQAVDIIEAFMYAEDVILIVLDSIASLTTQAEIDKSAEDETVAARARVMSKLVNKVTSAFGKIEKEKRRLVLLGINQIRMKIGVTFGNPETTPGGNAWRFMTCLRLRVHSRPVLDKNVHPGLPAYLESEIRIKRAKVPLASMDVKYKFMLLPQRGMSIGTVPYSDTFFKRAEIVGMMEHTGHKKTEWIWTDTGEIFKSKKTLVDWFREDPKRLHEAKVELIKRCVEAARNVQPVTNPGLEGL